MNLWTNVIQRSFWVQVYVPENVSKLKVTCWRDIEPSLLQKHEVVTDVSLRRVILAKVLSSVNTNLALCTPHQSFNVQIMRQARGQVWQFLFLVFCWNKTGQKILYQFISFIDTIDLIKFQGGGTVKILP